MKDFKKYVTCFVSFSIKIIISQITKITLLDDIFKILHFVKGKHFF